MKTIIFSNIMGDVFGEDEDVSFLPDMDAILLDWKMCDCELVYIDAPMDGYDSNVVFENILKCFKKLNVVFNKIQFVGKENLTICNSKKTVKKKVYFLTGGNPLTQMEIIKKNRLEKDIIESEYCIGFCAGGMNISQFGILTSDEDFEKPLTYKALGRVGLSIEPHFNYRMQKEKEPLKYKKRIAEIKAFIKELRIPIFAVPDSSLLYFEDDVARFLGEIVVFNRWFWRGVWRFKEKQEPEQ